MTQAARQIETIRGYIEQRGGRYLYPQTKLILEADTVKDHVPEGLYNGAGSVVEYPNGTVAIYTWFSMRRGKRSILLKRLPDQEPQREVDTYNPYTDDPHLETYIQAPRSVIRKTYEVECASCGKTSLAYATRLGSEKIFRDRGWHDTNARGWV